jgi:prophage DNA circulation protein
MPTPVNANLPRASFNSIPFPFTSRDVELTGRYHVHEFPKMAGGAVEKMGRKVYEFTFDAPFHATNPRFTNLYPDSLNRFTTMAETQETAVLVVPEIGSIRAFIAKINRRRQGKIQSGEEVVLHFVEDDVEPFRKVVAPTSTASFNEAVSSYFAAIDGNVEIADDIAFPTKWFPLKSPFALLQDAINLIGSIQDQFDLYGNLLAAKLEKVATLCKTIHSLVTFLQHPRNQRVQRALRDLWDATHKVQGDLKRLNRQTVPYRVPATMSVGAIAQSYYGDASRGGEIMTLNRIPTPFAVKAGTTLNVYPKTAA